MHWYLIAYVSLRLSLPLCVCVFVCALEALCLISLWCRSEWVSLAICWSITAGNLPPSCCYISLLYILLVCTKFNSSMNRKKRKDPALPSDARRWHMSPGANIVRVCVHVYVSMFVCVLVLGKQIIKYMPSWTAVRCVNSPWIQCRCVCACVCVCERRTLEAFPASNSKLETTLLLGWLWLWLWLWLPLGRLRRRADAALSERGRY